MFKIYVEQVKVIENDKREILYDYVIREDIKKEFKDIDELQKYILENKLSINKYYFVEKVQ